VIASDNVISLQGVEAHASLPNQELGTLDVVVVNDFAHVNGGAAEVALSSAVGLAGRGHKVTLLAAVAPVAPELGESGVRVVLTDQFDIKSDPNRLRAAFQGIWNPRAAKQTSRVLAHCDPKCTIVHVHGWCKALSSSVVREADRLGFRVVLTLHDYFYTCPSGGFFNFPQEKICHLRPLSTACILENCDRDGYAQKLWRSLRQEVQNTVGSFGDIRFFITLSDFSEEILRPLLPPDATLYRVPNPINVERRPAVDVARNQQFVALGRMSAEKGLTLLARAAADLGCELTVIGDGPSRQEVCSLYPRTRVTGWLSKSEVTQHLGLARALVFPSIWYEAQPLVVGEAAASGVPAIVPDQCAAREWVVNGITGLWFESGSVSDLTAKMTQLQDSETAGRMGRAAYENYWRSPATMTKHIEKLETCYQSILHSRLNEKQIQYKSPSCSAL
jgi:glycosyltransferase involved in cell wall biosynthesis